MPLHKMFKTVSLSYLICVMFVVFHLQWVSIIHEQMTLQRNT